MDLKELDYVLLKDGRKATIVFVPNPSLKSDYVEVDVGSSPKDWETIAIKRDEIVKKLN